MINNTHEPEQTTRRNRNVHDRDADTASNAAGVLIVAIIAIALLGTAIWWNSSNETVAPSVSPNSTTYTTGNTTANTTNNSTDMTGRSTMPGNTNTTGNNSTTTP